jgi:hypothetical protein
VQNRKEKQDSQDGKKKQARCNRPGNDLSSLLVAGFTLDTVLLVMTIEVVSLF